MAHALANRLAEVMADLKGESITVLVSESDYTHSADFLNHLFVIERGMVDEKRLQHCARRATGQESEA